MERSLNIANGWQGLLRTFRHLLQLARLQRQLAARALRPPHCGQPGLETMLNEDWGCLALGSVNLAQSRIMLVALTFSVPSLNTQVLAAERRCAKLVRIRPCVRGLYARQAPGVPTQINLSLLWNVKYVFSERCHCHGSRSFEELGEQGITSNQENSFIISQFRFCIV